MDKTIQDYLFNLTDREKKSVGLQEFKIYLKNGKWMIDKIDYKNGLEKEVTQTIEVPKKQWFNLTEACELKGINFKSACNKPYLKPNCGKEDGIIAGRKSWKLETILRWLNQDDSELKEIFHNRKK